MPKSRKLPCSATVTSDPAAARSRRAPPARGRARRRPPPHRRRRSRPRRRRCPDRATPPRDRGRRRPAVAARSRVRARATAPPTSPGSPRCTRARETLAGAERCARSHARPRSPALAFITAKPRAGTVPRHADTDGRRSRPADRCPRRAPSATPGVVAIKAVASVATSGDDRASQAPARCAAGAQRRRPGDRVCAPARLCESQRGRATARARRQAAGSTPTTSASIACAAGARDPCCSTSIRAVRLAGVEPEPPTARYERAAVRTDGPRQVAKCDLQHGGVAQHAHTRHRRAKRQLRVVGVSRREIRRWRFHSASAESAADQRLRSRQSRA